MQESSEMRAGASSGLKASYPQPPQAETYLDICGRHRKQVELNRLSKEISLLEEELKMLEGLSLASQCCKSVVENVEKRSDPLLPFVTEGQSTSSWERWFKERSTDTDYSCFCSCRQLKVRKISHWKRFTCWKPNFRQASCLIPRFNCCTCCCFQSHRTGCIKCCNVHRKK